MQALKMWNLFGHAHKISNEVSPSRSAQVTVVVAHLNARTGCGGASDLMGWNNPVVAVGKEWG